MDLVSLKLLDLMANLLRIHGVVINICYIFELVDVEVS